jgi:ORF6N domain
MADNRAMVPLERIESRIFLIRGQKVMLDADLARLYEVETRALVQAVKRNIERFPADFMFQLTQKEFDFLRSQSVISNPKGRGGRRYMPYHVRFLCHF